MPKRSYRAQHVEDFAYSLQLAMVLDAEVLEAYDDDLSEMVDLLLLASAEPLCKRLKTAVGTEHLSMQRLRREAGAVAGEGEEWINRHVSSGYNFELDDLPRVVDALRVPSRVVTRGRHCFSGEELVLLTLRRFRRLDPAHELTKETGRSMAAISEGVNWMLEHMLRNFAHLVDERSLLCWAPHFPAFANAFANCGVPVDNLAGIIDGKVWGTCKPIRNHRFSFNGHKWMYGTKTQGVTLANGARHNPLPPACLSL